MSNSEAQEVSTTAVVEADAARVRFLSLTMRNFLSYKQSTVTINDFVALVGANASGKSNAVAGLRLLGEIRNYGLPLALMRRGGFDQLRHRSSGRPNDPTVRIAFSIAGGEESFYEVALGAIKGGRYRVKRECASIWWNSRCYRFTSDGSQVEVRDGNEETRISKVAPGQSAMPSAGMTGFLLFDVLGDIQTLDINPKVVGDLQEPSSTEEFLPDGGNVASIFESLSTDERQAVTEDLAALVPGVERIEVVHLADRVTLRFHQVTSTGRTRQFLARQMSDGTLRMFAILLAAHRLSAGGLLVVEEPETAIHVGALHGMVELLQGRSGGAQVLITTHSSDIVDALPIDDLRVVWLDGDSSRIATVATHTKATVSQQLMHAGELLRSDLLDPEIA